MTNIPDKDSLYYILNFDMFLCALLWRGHHKKIFMHSKSFIAPFSSKLCHCCGGNGIVAPMQWRNNPQEIATWWRHQRETFSALLAICGNSPVTVEFPAQRPVTRSFEVFFDLHRNNRSSKPSWTSVLRRQHAHYDASVMEAHQSCIDNSWAVSHRHTHIYMHIYAYACILRMMAHAVLSPVYCYHQNDSSLNQTWDFLTHRVFG